MKSKKLISLLCAAAMSASAFAGLTVTASAADSVLYSNNFNGFENNKMLVVARPSGDMPSTWIDAANGGNELFKALINEQTPNEYTFTDADKATVLVKAGETNPDDTAIVYAYAKADDADDTYISLPKSRFSNKTGGMKLDLSSLKAADGEDLVVSFKAMLSAATDGETATFNVGSATGTPSLAATDLEAGTWGDVRLVVTSAGVATLYVNNEQKSTGTVALSEGLTFWVDQYSGGTKKSDGIYARVNIDDLVVMSAAAGTGATVTVPAAKDPEDTTGPVVEQKQAAPSLIAPSSVTPVVNQKFDKAVNINSQTGDDGDTSIDGLKVVLGNVDDSVTGVSTSDYAKGDKVLKMTGGTKSTAGRGPIVSAVDTLPLSDDNSSVMTFAVNLGTTSSTGAGRLYILQSTRQAGSDNLGEYNAVMAALATDDYSYSNGDTSVAINNLDADTWYKVAIVVSSDKYRVWVAKADEDWSTSAQVQNDHVGQGESNLTVTELPMLAVTSSTATKSDGTAASNLTYSTVRIDNMLTYSGTASEPRRLLPTSEAAPTPAPIPAKVTMSVDETANTVTLTSDKDTDAVLVQASYRTDKTLDSVKKVVNVTLTAGTPYTVPATDLDAFTTNDKIMVWDSLKTMTPLASAYTIKNGAAQATAKPAPTAEPTEAPAETVAPTTEPTEAPAETVAPTTEPPEIPVTTAAPTATPAPTDTPAPTATAVPTYAVSGTVDAGVKSVTLTDKAEAENTITGTIVDTAVTFTGVKAGTYTISAVAASGKDIDTIKVGDTETTEVTVTDANVTNLAVTSKDEAVVPYADGTNTYDTEGAANSFVDYSRVTVSIADGVNGNTTKVQNLKTGGGISGAGYNPYTVAFPAKGEAVATSFDISIPTRNAWVSVRGTQPGTSDRNNNAAGRIFTIGAEGSSVIKIYSGADVVDEITGTDIITKWYHVDAVVNNTTKKVAIKVYDYKANNNYTKETALYDKTVDFRDNTVAGVVAMDYHSNTANGNMQLDNLYINDPSYVAPINVTAKDATVDKAQVVKDDVITITPTVPAGKKLSAVKVNGTAVTAADGKYTYTVTGEESAIAVTADFVRADVNNVVVSSTNKDVQVGTTGKYAAVAYADADKNVALAATDTPITWSVESATEGVSLATGTSIANDGTLTVAADQAVGKLAVKATVKKDITSDDATDANKVVGTFEVNVIAEKSFQVVAATVENGKVAFKVGDTENATSFKESETLEIVPTANAGYELDTVSYKLTSAEDETYTTVASTEGKYTVAGSAITGDITVKVTFKAINYTVTNSNADADTDGNKLTVDKTTAIVGDTVTVTPTLAEGAKIALSIKNAENGDVAYTAGENGTYTFTMPASNVTISAQFTKVKTVELNSSKIAGTYVDFRSENADTSYISTNAGKYSFGQAKLASGKLSAANVAYADTSIVALVSVDASEYAGKIYGASITYDFTAAANNSWINAIGTYENYIDLSAEDASVTGNNVNTLGGTATNTYTFTSWQYGSTKNSTVTLTTPIDDIFTKDADGKVTMYMYTGTGRLQTLSNVKITLTVADDATTSATE